MSIWIERVLVAEHELGQRLGEQRLADAGRPGEDEAADRPLRVLADRLRLRRTALAIALIASSWLMTLLCSSSSILQQARRSLRSSSRVSGMPVILQTTSAIDFLVDDAVDLLAPSRATRG